MKKLISLTAFIFMSVLLFGQTFNNNVQFNNKVRFRGLTSVNDTMFYFVRGADTCRMGIINSYFTCDCTSGIDSIHFFPAVSGGGGSSTNIYNSDGTLTGDRVLSLGSHYLAIRDSSDAASQAMFNHGYNQGRVVQLYTDSFATLMQFVTSDSLEKVSIGTSHSGSPCKFCVVDDNTSGHLLTIRGNTGVELFEGFNTFVSPAGVNYNYMKQVTPMAQNNFGTRLTEPFMVYDELTGKFVMGISNRGTVTFANSALPTDKQERLYVGGSERISDSLRVEKVPNDNALTKLVAWGVDSGFYYRDVSSLPSDSGTVTSVAKGYGIKADGTITTTGTITADTTILVNKTGTQTLTNKLMSTGDVWQGTSIDTTYTNAVSNVVAGSNITVTTSGKSKFVAARMDTLTIGSGITGNTYNGSANKTILAPNILNIGSGDSVLNTIGLQYSSIDFGGFTGCKVEDCVMLDGATIHFTANDQIIEGWTLAAHSNFWFAAAASPLTALGGYLGSYSTLYSTTEGMEGITVGDASFNGTGISVDLSAALVYRQCNFQQNYLAPAVSCDDMTYDREMFSFVQSSSGADISPQNIGYTDADALYEIKYYFNTVTTDVGAGTSVALNIYWTDQSGTAQLEAISTINLQVNNANYSGYVRTFHHTAPAAATMQYEVVGGGTYGTATYELTLSVKKIHQY